ncbi:MAG: ATP-binding protein [Fidelibacterota bacterium]|nr:MAG: ATP-binding protein [Candidatus Neomarinimicrobiota bacterium]
MEDLSLHILDIVENSIRSGAREIQILIREEPAADLLEIEVKDDGMGMNAETQAKALDPFYTTRSTRRIGLGLSLFRESARQAGGDLVVASVPGKGTCIKATFQLSHIDRKPIGDMGQTLQTLMIGNPDIHYRYIHFENGKENHFDSRDLDPSHNDVTGAGGEDLSAQEEPAPAFHTSEEQA